MGLAYYHCNLARGIVVSGPANDDLSLARSSWLLLSLLRPVGVGDPLVPSPAILELNDGVPCARFHSADRVGLVCGANGPTTFGSQHACNARCPAADHLFWVPLTTAEDLRTHISRNPWSYPTNDTSPRSCLQGLSNALFAKSAVQNPAFSGAKTVAPVSRSALSMALNGPAVLVRTATVGGSFLFLPSPTLVFPSQPPKSATPIMP